MKTPAGIISCGPRLLNLRSIPLGQLNMRSITPQPDTYDEPTHSVEAIMITESVVQVIDWDRWEIIDEIILMEGVTFPANNQIPLLDSHDRYTVEAVLGSAREFQDVVVNGVRGKKCRLYFSSTEEGVSAETKVKEGHLTDLSIGYHPDERVWIPEGTKATVNGKEYQGPVQICTATSVSEVSLCPIGADEMAKTRATRMTPELRQLLIQRGMPENATPEEMIRFMKEELQRHPNQSTRSIHGKESVMTPEELEAKRKKEEEERLAAEKAQREAAEKARKEEGERIANIYATAEKHAGRVKDINTLRDQAIKDGWSAERFGTEVLGRYSEATNPVPAAAAPVTGLRDLTKPWQRRAVNMLRGKTFQALGNQERAQQLLSQVEKEVREMTDVQRNAEDVEAAEMIRTSGLTLYQQYRLASSLTDGAGKYLVPTPLLAEIFILVEKWGVARRYFRPVPMTADTLKLDSLVTEAVAYWATQGSNITASDLVFGQGTLSVAKLAGISSWTTELEESAAIAWLPIFVESLARAIKKKEDLAGFIGDGSATYGSFTGMLAASTNVVTMSQGKTAFSQADADDYKSLRDAVNIDFREGAMFFLSPGEVSNLEGLKDLQGRYVYREPAAGLPAMLWGYPIADSVGINALTQTSAAATRFAGFGNPKHILMGMKRELDLVISREGVLDSGGTISFNALQADGAIVRMTERVGFKQVLTLGISVLKTAAN